MDGHGLSDNPLFDIVPTRASVTLNGKTFEIQGVPFRVIMSIAREAPDVLSFFFGGKITISTMIESSPKAVERIIAAGFGLPDDERAERFAGDLPLDVQLDLLAAILTQSTGGGAGPFVAKLKALQTALGGAAAPEPPKERPIRFKMREPTQAPPFDSPQSPEPSNSSSPAAA